MDCALEVQAKSGETEEHLPIKNGSTTRKAIDMKTVISNVARLFGRRGAGESGGVSKADNPTSDASVYLGKFTKNRTIMVGMQNTISKIPRAPYP